MTDYCLIYSTHPDHAQAAATAQALLTQRLAACCNILAPMQSHYRWEGTFATAQEVPMLTKTTAAQAAAAMAAIAAHHPYECPAILQIPLENGHLPFFQWIQDQTAHSSD